MDHDDLTALLPVLAERPNAGVLDRTTGELLDADDPAAIKRACGAIVDAYALAVHKAEALRLEIEAKRAPRIAAALQAIEAELADDLDYQAALVERSRAQAEVEIILEGLNGALDGRTGDFAISLDTGSALVTWGKARETWSLAHPASWYATPAARRSLEQVLGQVQLLQSPAERIKDGADRVLAWLDPTAKLSELPPVRVTLRSGK